MSVVSMKLVNIIGLKKDFEYVSKKVIKEGLLHPYNIFHEIKTETSIHQKEEHLCENTLKKMEYIWDNLKPYMKHKKIDRDICDLELLKIEKKVESIYNEIQKLTARREALIQKQNNLKTTQIKMRVLEESDINISDIKNSEYISWIFGRLPLDAFRRIRKNLESFPLVVVNIIYSTNNSAWVICFTPSSMREKTLKILASLNFEHDKLTVEFEDTPANIIKQIEVELEDIEFELQEIEFMLKRIAHEYRFFLTGCYLNLKIAVKACELGREAGNTEHFFIIRGFIPEDRLLDFARNITSNPTVSLIEEDLDEKITIPTLLKNSVLFKPFEFIVKTYGTPAYGEHDPTMLVGIIYFLLFGIMFGDLGQGFIIFALGHIISRTNNQRETGQLFKYVGISSMVFGALYGSLFGYEDIIPGVLQPLHNINFVLIASVALGIILISISIIINIINSIRMKNFHGLLFDKNGIAGLMFYWSSVFGVAANYKYKFLPQVNWVIFLLLALPIISILFRNKILKLLGFEVHENEGFVDALFETFETLLGFLSNTISFIRIGAFAINHAGLFSAVFVLSELVRNSSGSGLLGFLVVVLGNILIIGLEGLVVAIQDLRLVYYEMFTRFFIGEGIEYAPYKISEKL